MTKGYDNISVSWKHRPTVWVLMNQYPPANSLSYKRVLIWKMDINKQLILKQGEIPTNDTARQGRITAPVKSATKAEGACSGN